MPKSLFRTLLLAVAPLALSGFVFPVAHADNPATTHADVPSLPTVAKAMREAVAAHEVAGVVTLVADDKRTLHLDATGLADVEGNVPMQADSIFWIASMTKPITATSIMMLQEQGKLAVDDPVAKYLPELKDLKTPDGQPAKITIRHCLTHTSGMGEISNEQAQTAKTLADLIPMFAKLPLKFEPGSKWTYCQSGINMAGRIVEVVSGQSLPEFFQSHVFDPLGMQDTTFYLSDVQMKRLAKSYKTTSDGKLEPATNFILLGKAPTSRDRFPAANGGLFSTAPDYARFLQMILNGGEWAGRRYLKPETVRQMTSLQTGDLKTGFTPGNGWGLGWCIAREPQGVSEALSPGSFGHGGAYGTQAWVDPVKKRVYVLMVQRANFPNSDASDVRKKFQDTAAAELAAGAK